MAGKSRRVASRQGELSRRRKRTQRGPSGIPAVRSPGAPGGSAAMEAVAVGAAAGAATSAPPESAPAPAAPATSGRPGATAGAAQSRGPVRARGERPAAYNYVGAELRRIGILSVVALGALIGLAFVL